MLAPAPTWLWQLCLALFIVRWQLASGWPTAADVEALEQLGGGQDAAGAAAGMAALAAYNEACRVHGLGAKGEAVRLYTEALALQPRFARAHLNLATLLPAERRAVAEYHLKEAVACAEDDEGVLANALTSLGLHVQEDAAHRTASRTRDAELEAAALLHERALRLAPQHSDALFNLGAVRLMQERFEDSLALSEAVLALEPARVAALQNAEVAAHALHQHSDALRYARAAVAAAVRSAQLPERVARALLANAGDGEGAALLPVGRMVGDAFPACVWGFGPGCRGDALFQRDDAAVEGSAGGNVDGRTAPLAGERLWKTRVDVQRTLLNLGTKLQDLGMISPAARAFGWAVFVYVNYVQPPTPSGEVAAEKSSTARVSLTDAFPGVFRSGEVASDYILSVIGLQKSLSHMLWWAPFHGMHSRMAALVNDFLRAAGVAECGAGTSAVEDVKYAMSGTFELMLSHAMSASALCMHARLVNRQRTIKGAAAHDPTAHGGKTFRRPLVGERLVVGYVSFDFLEHVHPMSRLISGLLEGHARTLDGTMVPPGGPGGSALSHHQRSQTVATRCYNTGAARLLGESANVASSAAASLRDSGDPTASSLPAHALRNLAACGAWIDVAGRSATETAALVEAHGVHVLVDLMGLTRGASVNLFASQPAPAPVLVNYLGFPGTVGLPQVHFIVADRVILRPESAARELMEKVIVLPQGRTYQVNRYSSQDYYLAADDGWDESTAAFRPDRASSSRATFVFANFNSFDRLSPISFDVWMRVLKAVPGSVLWLVESPKKHPGGAAASLRREAASRGVAPERIVFVERRQWVRHMARYVRDVGLFLDTFAYGAHTTAADCIHGGTPILTLLGDTFQSRVPASIITAASSSTSSLRLSGSELREAPLQLLIARTVREYEDTAVRLAWGGLRGARRQQRPRPQAAAALGRLRRALAISRGSSAGGGTLLPRISPLFDNTGTARALEQGYHAAYEVMRAAHRPMHLVLGDCGATGSANPCPTAAQAPTLSAQETIVASEADDSGTVARGQALLLSGLETKRMALSALAPAGGELKYAVQLAAKALSEGCAAVSLLAVRTRRMPSDAAAWHMLSLAIYVTHSEVRLELQTASLLPSAGLPGVSPECTPMDGDEMGEVPTDPSALLVRVCMTALAAARRAAALVPLELVYVSTVIEITVKLAEAVTGSRKAAGPAAENGAAGLAHSALTALNETLNSVSGLCTGRSATAAHVACSPILASTPTLMLLIASSAYIAEAPWLAIPMQALCYTHEKVFLDRLSSAGSVRDEIGAANASGVIDANFSMAFFFEGLRQAVGATRGGRWVHTAAALLPDATVAADLLYSCGAARYFVATGGDESGDDGDAAALAQSSRILRAALAYSAAHPAHILRTLAVVESARGEADAAHAATRAHLLLEMQHEREVRRRGGAASGDRCTGGSAGTSEERSCSDGTDLSEDEARMLAACPSSAGLSVVALFCHEYGQSWWPRWGPSFVDAAGGGLGGSEEAVVFLSRELAALGYAVHVYADPPDADLGADPVAATFAASQPAGSPGSRGYVCWRPWFLFSAFTSGGGSGSMPEERRPPDVFVTWRYFASAMLGLGARARFAWFQDVIHGFKKALSPRFVELLNGGALMVSEFHARIMLPDGQRPSALRVTVAPNALNPAYFTDGANDDRAFIYASSPGRGLEEVLVAWPRIRARVPGARLGVYYGFTRAFLAWGRRTNPGGFDAWLARMHSLLAQEGVTYHGLVNHSVLHAAYAASGFTLYPTSFGETSCISLMKAQALGAIPITSRYPHSALPETCGRFDWGPAPPPAAFKPGSSLAADPEWLAAWVEAVVGAATRPADEIAAHRAAMMAHSRSHHLWGSVAAKWSAAFQQVLSAADSAPPPSALLGRLNA